MLVNQNFFHTFASLSEAMLKILITNMDLDMEFT